MGVFFSGEGGEHSLAGHHPPIFPITSYFLATLGDLGAGDDFCPASYFLLFFSGNSFFLFFFLFWGVLSLFVMNDFLLKFMQTLLSALSSKLNGFLGGSSAVKHFM